MRSERLIYQYLEALGAGRVLLVAKERPMIDTNGMESFEIRAVCREEIDAVQYEPDLVIVSDTTLADCRMTHRLCQRFKQAGIPVVFGDARPIFTSVPRYQDIGLSYSGMFRIAASYLRPIRSQFPNTSFHYIEFGVFDGRTFTLAYQCFKEIISDFFALDTFTGIKGTMTSEKAQFAEGNFYSNLETFEFNLKVAGADRSRINIIEGDFRDIDPGDPRLPPEGRIAVAHIDCDVYAAALAALNLLGDRLLDGALLMFDDYDSLLGAEHNGERRAVREWLDANPNFSLELYRCYGATCRAFIFHRQRPEFKV